MHQQPDAPRAQADLENALQQVRAERDQLWRDLERQLIDFHALIRELRVIAVALERDRNPAPSLPSTGLRIITSWLWIAYAIIVTLGLAVLVAVFLSR